MYKSILVPIDLANPELAKPALETAVMMANQSDGTIRLVNVLPLTPVMLAEYVPADFEAQQRKAAEEALANGKKKDAMQQSNRAKQMLTKNSPSYFRAEDIRREAEHLDD